VLNEKNINLFKKYKELSEKEKKIHFLGRLANYKYFNMDEAILNSLNYFENFFQVHK
jgi:UDP-galactopyranose mutase